MIATSVRDKRNSMNSILPQGSSNKRIIRATVIVMGIAVAGKVLGFVQNLLIAYVFGTSMEVDAYFVAFSIPVILSILVREIIEPAFLPTFMGVMEKDGEIAAWKLFSTTINALLILFAVLTLLGIVGSPFLVSILAPGFEGMKRIITIKLIRIILPASVFLGVSAVTYITLNSYKRFTVPALGDFCFKVFIIITFLVSVRVMGIVGLAIGVVVGALVRLLVHLLGLWKKRNLYKYTLDFKYPPMKRMQRLMLPLIVGITFSQLGYMVDNVFASTLETGSLSALTYAKKVVQMPLIVLPYTLAIIIFPFFSELALSNKKKDLLEMFMQATKLLAFLFIPMAIGLIVLRTPVVRLLFERGAFDLYSTQITSSAVLYYSLGLPSCAVEAILVQFYFSMSDTKTPVAVGMFCVLLNFLLIAVLIKPLTHCGIALAFTISTTVRISIMYVLLKKKIPDIRMSDPLIFLLKVVCASSVMGLSVSFVSHRLAHSNLTSLTEQSVGLLVSILVGILVFLTTAYLMRVEEMKLYWRQVKFYFIKVRK